MVKGYVLSDIYASRTLTRRVATPNDVRKKVSQNTWKTLFYAFLIIWDKIDVFPFRKFFPRNFCVSDVNEARGDAQRRPKKISQKHLENTFLCISDHLGQTPL